MNRNPTPALLGGNLVIASVLAILSYVPFIYVAKGSLIVVAFMFIVDPFPPLSRIIALVSLIIIGLLSKAYNKHERSIEEEIERADAEYIEDEMNNATTNSNDLINDSSEDHHESPTTSTNLKSKDN